MIPFFDRKIKDSVMEKIGLRILHLATNASGICQAI